MRLDAAPQPMGTLGRHPILEAGSVRYSEALQEDPAGQLGRLGPPLLSHSLVEEIYVESDGPLGHQDSVGVGVEHAITRVPPDDAEGLVERVARRRLGLIAPQESDQVLTRALPIRRPREVEQERQVLSPRELAWGRIATDRELDHPQSPNVEYRAARFR